MEIFSLEVYETYLLESFNCVWKQNSKKPLNGQKSGENNSNTHFKYKIEIINWKPQQIVSSIDWSCPNTICMVTASKTYAENTMHITYAVTRQK